MFLDGDLTIEDLPAASHREGAEQQTVIEWFREGHNERSALNQLCRSDAALGGVEWTRVGRADAERACVGTLQRRAVGIVPIGADDERVRVSGNERASHLPVRQNAFLHPSRIEEHRESRAVAIPELVVEREEWPR